MRKYIVSGSCTISVQKTVEASSPEEALKIAKGLMMPDLCWSCSEGGDLDDSTWGLSGSLDGDPSANPITVKEK